MESFGRIFEVIVTVVLLFFVPLSYSGAKEDMICQTYVTTETSLFVEAVRNRGCLTKKMYELFLKKLNETNHVYEIELTHYEEQISYEQSVTSLEPLSSLESMNQDKGKISSSIKNRMAENNEKGNEILDSIEENIYMGNYYGIYTDDIIEALYETEAENYTMKQGDYFVLKVHNKDKTYGTKLQEWFLQKSLNVEQIYVVYGGAIRNEIN